MAQQVKAPGTEHSDLSLVFGTHIEKERSGVPWSLYMFHDVYVFVRSYTQNNEF